MTGNHSIMGTIHYGHGDDYGLQDDGYTPKVNPVSSTGTTKSLSCSIRAAASLSFAQLDCDTQSSLKTGACPQATLHFSIRLD